MNADRRTLTCLTLLALLAAAPTAAGDESYSFVRVLEGSATIAPAGGAAAESAEINLPLLTGDRLDVSADSRVELVLADRNRLRLDGASALVLTAIAFSDDATDRVTRLQLLGGRLQLSVGDAALGDELPRIDLSNATVYVQDVASLAIESDGEGWSEVVVRTGRVEVLTGRGSTLVRAGESARITGTASAAVRLGVAPPADAFERWASAQEADSAVRTAAYVDPGLAYSSNSLEDNGSWVYAEDSWAWRPRVGVDWRPYWNGRWYPTPSGLTWVSSEPWGWVPYHYGTWDLAPGYGWVWYPGRTYSPAWVYWYWGDRWAGWCPTGYYTRHYRRAGGWHHGFRAGLYGSIGGDFGLYSHWNFGPSDRLFDRHHRGGRGGYRRGGADLAREVGGRGLPRGILTTDTRGLDPGQLRNGRDPRTLLRNPGDRPVGAIDRLPDMTEFIARKPELSPEVGRRVMVEKPAGGLEDGDARRITGVAEGRPPANEVGGARRERPGEGTVRLDERPAGRAGTPPAVATSGTGDARGTASGNGGRTERSPGIAAETGFRGLDQRPARRTVATPAETGTSAAGPRDPAAWEGAPAGRAPRIEAEGEGRRLDERPARRAPVPGLEGTAPTTVKWRERPAAVPSGGATFPTEGRQNWRRPGDSAGARPTEGTTAAPRSGNWSSPAPRTPRPSADPAVEAEGGGRRARPVGEVGTPLPWTERPARGTGPRSGATEAASRVAPGASDRPPVRRVIDGVRQTPSGGPAAGTSSSWQRGPRPGAAPQASPAPRSGRSAPAEGRAGGSSKSEASPRRGGEGRKEGSPRADPQR